MSLAPRCFECDGLRPGQVNPRRDLYCQCLRKQVMAPAPKRAGTTA